MQEQGAQDAWHLERGKVDEAEEHADRCRRHQKWTENGLGSRLPSGETARAAATAARVLILIQDGSSRNVVSAAHAEVPAEVATVS